jgi:hypothetical protein
MRALGGQIEMMFPFTGDLTKPEEGVDVDPCYMRFG